MHETIVAQQALRVALEEARRTDARRVSAIKLRVGEMEGIERGPLAEAFAVVSEGTPAQGARLDVEPVAARLACAACGRAPATSVPGHEGEALARCPCGGRYRVLEGAGWSVASVRVVT